MAPQATADQRHIWETGQTPHQETATSSQHARCLTPLPQPIKSQPSGHTGETTGGKNLLPSWLAHHQPRGSSQPNSALTSSVIWLLWKVEDMTRPQILFIDGMFRGMEEGQQDTAPARTNDPMSLNGNQPQQLWHLFTWLHILYTPKKT